MGTFLFSLLAGAMLQGVGTRDSTDSVRTDSATRALGMARAAFARWEAVRMHPTDTVVLRMTRDSVDDALAQAASFGLPGTNPVGDSARVLRVAEWSTRALDVWTVRGLGAGPEVWGPLPADLRLTPVLEELGENLLRACPEGGILLTSRGPDFLAAWYMRFARGLRPDLAVTPLAAWEGNEVFRARMIRDLRLGPEVTKHVVEALAAHRPVCASMGLESPPEHLHWRAWPLVWVAGPRAKDAAVSPRDFVFAAFGASGGDPWALSALEVYNRATAETPALCAALAAFKVGPPQCRR